MNENKLRQVVQRVILTELGRRGQRFVPVMSSNKHVHLSQSDVEKLFGRGYQLTKMRDLVQPGQYACNERVMIQTKKGKMMLRVVGPARKDTQVELSYTDCVQLGLRAPVRMSGDLDGSAGCTLINGDARVELSQGVIIAARHLHLAKEEAVAFGLADGDIISLAVEGMRATTLQNVVVRCGDGHVMEAHIDTDEANACALNNGQLCALISAEATQTSKAEITTLLGQMMNLAEQTTTAPPSPQKSNLMDLTAEKRCLITEEQVYEAVKEKMKIIRYAKDAIVTPLAKDVALEKGIALVVMVDEKE